MKCKYFYIVLITTICASGKTFALSVLPGFKPDSIQIIFDRQQLVLPGESFKIGVVSFHKKGKIRKTVGNDGGIVFWWRYKVEVTGGTFSGGKITVNKQLVPSKGKYISVKIFPKRKPGLSKKLLIPLNYETGIEFRPVNKFDKAPGAEVEGILIATFNNGMRRIYEKLRKEEDSGNFHFEPVGGKWEKGIFTVDSDFTKIKNHKAQLVIQPLRNPGLSYTFNLLLDYKFDCKLLFKGDDGNSGLSGTNGSSGLIGCDGSNGGHGQDGEPGYNGPDVGVWADLYFDSVLNCHLLYVIAENFETGQEFKYLINPDGGSLAVNTIGGNGGNGGDGGHGGSGGPGRDGEIWYEQKRVTRIVQQPRTRMVKKTVKARRGTKRNPEETEIEILVPETYYVDVVVEEIITVPHRTRGGDGGNGGNGGAGGFGGHGGDGGSVYFYFTEDGWIFENLFFANSIGGLGGKHGYGGRGGNGGAGGIGEPCGGSGYKGRNGYSPVGWDYRGAARKVFRGPTEEFFFDGSEENAPPESVSDIMKSIGY